MSLFTNCQGDSQTTEKSKTEQRKNNNKKKNPNQKKANKKKNTAPKLLPPIGKLKKSQKKTRAYIYNISDKSVTKDKQPFRITDDIVVKGIGIDQPRKTVAEGVYVKIGKQYFKADYGKPSKDFATKAKNPKYAKAGFVVTIPKGKIKKGDYEVGVCVVSSDRKTYYEQEKKVSIKVR